MTINQHTEQRDDERDSRDDADEIAAIKARNPPVSEEERAFWAEYYARIRRQQNASVARWNAEHPEIVAYLAGKHEREMRELAEQYNQTVAEVKAWAEPDQSLLDDLFGDG